MDRQCELSAFVLSSPSACHLWAITRQGLNSRLERLDRLIVSLPDAAAAATGNDGGRSGIELTPSDDAAAIGREHRLLKDAHNDQRCLIRPLSAQSLIAEKVA
jgi:hypothetical protein